MDIRQVAKLAHLEITDAEVALYTPQMAEIVKYIEQLNEVDTANIEPMLGGLTTEGEATATIREDVSRECLGQKAGAIAGTVSSRGPFSGAEGTVKNAH